MVYGSSYDENSFQVDGVEVGFRDGGDGRRRRRSDRELSKIRADIGMVFQLFNLFPHLTALENVMLGLRKVRGLSRDDARRAAERWLAPNLAYEPQGRGVPEAQGRRGAGAQE